MGWINGLWQAPLSVKFVAGMWFAGYAWLTLAMLGDGLSGGLSAPATAIGAVMLTLVGGYLTIGSLRMSWWAILGSLALGAAIAWGAAVITERNREASPTIKIVVELIFAIPLGLVVLATIWNWRRLSWHPLGRSADNQPSLADTFT